MVSGNMANWSLTTPIESGYYFICDPTGLARIGKDVQIVYFRSDDLILQSPGSDVDISLHHKTTSNIYFSERIEIPELPTGNMPNACELDCGGSWMNQTANTNIFGKHIFSGSSYLPSKKYLKIAQEVTQEYIESYGASFGNIDDLDRMIASAIEKALREVIELRYRTTRK